MRIPHLLIASLQGEATPDELRELDAWRCESEANERHYQELVRIWGLTRDGDRGISVGPSPSVEVLLGDVAPEPGQMELVRPSLVRLREGGWSRLRTPGRRQVARAAALAVVVLGGLGIWRLAPRDETGDFAADQLVTGMSETATVNLKDGSVVRVGPSSTLSIPQSPSDARVVELRGRAFFAIARDEAHPFRVRTHAGNVTVLGTRFDLRVEGHTLRVIVLEGTVSLAVSGHETLVKQGEMGRILESTLLPPVRIPNPITAMEWTGRFLAFQDTPLDQVAREIAREYGVEVRLADSALVHRTVTGWFADRTLDDVLRIVCPVALVACANEGGVVTMRPLPNDGS